jgi:UDP-glucose:(glucosyl)LPS alpha-1,2-glucosyltransferase
MSEIIMGEFKRNETNINSMGGTERMTLELANRIDKEVLNEFQIISSRVRDLDESKIRIFWAHDLPGDPESQFIANENLRDKFHRYVFVSNWQMQQYIDRYDLPWSKCVVISNAIEPIPKHDKPSIEDGIRIIYTPTPHRGLNILVPVFESLQKKHSNIHLDVFSSFDLYGWKERDSEYKELFDRIDSNPNMTNHGTVSNDVIREHLMKSHIFAYPSIWPETSCLCLIEAMSAGLVCVHPNYAALPETAANWTHMYQFDEQLNRHAGIFHNILDIAISNYERMHVNAAPMKGYIDAFYNWRVRESEWTSFLHAMISQVKDRSFPSEMFKYKIS